MGEPTPVTNEELRAQSARVGAANVETLHMLRRQLNAVHRLMQIVMILMFIAILGNVAFVVTLSYRLDQISESIAHESK